jgi:hypothetical protein
MWRTLAAMRASDGVGWGGGLVIGGLSLVAGACNVTPGDATTFDGPPATSSVGTQGPSEDSGTTMATDPATPADDETTAAAKLDSPPPMPGGEGCEFVDFLFVIDNSASMATYQLALTEQFPQFIDKMYEALPPAIDVHVGMTTTDFDTGCDAQEATMNCQTTATLEEVEAHYIRPDMMNDGGNGSQGRLFSFAGQTYFETTSDEDPAPLTEWFTQAAVAAGEEGCSFEMPVAAAGFATHLANAVTNDGFVRDEGALLVVFFLTDEPDKSVESDETYADMIVQAKEGCGGKECVFVGGLVPECVIGNQAQKLWQFINQFDTVPPVTGDIELTQEYANVFGDGLAGAIAEACANVPAVG